jgi:hypothetical protein
MCFVSVNNTADVYVYADDSVAPGALTVRKVSSTGFERSVVVGISPFVSDSSQTGYQWRSVIHFSVDIAYWPLGADNVNVLMQVFDAHGRFVDNIAAVLVSYRYFSFFPDAIEIGSSSFSPVVITAYADWYASSAPSPLVVFKRGDGYLTSIVQVSDPTAWVLVSSYRWQCTFEVSLVSGGSYYIPDYIYLDVFLGEVEDVSFLGSVSCFVDL